MKRGSATSWVVCAPVLWAALMAPLAADETHEAVSLPGLQSDPAGTVEPDACTVSVVGNQVTLGLSLKASGDAPALLLEGAPFGWTGAAAPYSDRQFPELLIRLDGASITLEDRLEAFAGKANITDPLDLAQMDPWAITRSPPLTSAHPQNPQVLNVLKKLGAIEPSGDEYLAKWNARRIVRVPLKSAREQRIELQYTARPAAALVAVDRLDSPSRERTYCVSGKQLDRLAHGEAPGALLSVEEFVLPAGIDGYPPQSVTLSLSTGVGGGKSPFARVFFCGPHGKSIAKTGELTRVPAQTDERGVLRLLRISAPRT